MKIQCDVCNKTAASVFCVADEAALCTACDHRVHHANKLAGKHHRFALVSPKQIPLCDICQEKRAFLFCQQDRAILCRDCDFSIHKANELKRIHNRFLLTGIKLSVDSPVYSPPPPSAQSPPVAVAETTNLITSTTASPAPGDGGGVVNLPCSSSISDYLMETLPGWHVDDLLDFSSSPFDFCKGGEDLMMQIGEECGGVGGRDQCSTWPSEKSGIWVPQAPPPPPPVLPLPSPLHPSQYTVIPEPKPAVSMNYSKSNVSFETMNMNMIGKSTAARKRRDDWSFTVPQIIPPQSLSSKRFRFAG